MPVVLREFALSSLSYVACEPLSHIRFCGDKNARHSCLYHDQARIGRTLKGRRAGRIWQKDAPAQVAVHRGRKSAVAPSVNARHPHGASDRAAVFRAPACS